MTHEGTLSCHEDQRLALPLLGWLDDRPSGYWVVQVPRGLESAKAGEVMPSPKLHGAPPPGHPRQCKAKAVNSGERCRQWAVPGFEVCRYHGAGGAANHELGRRRVREAEQKAKAEAAVQTYGLPRDVDPWTALLEEVCRSAGAVRWLGERVAQLEAEELVFGITSEEQRDTKVDPGKTTTRTAAENIFSQLYFRERKHLASVSRDAIACGVAERQVRIAEEQGHVFAEMIRAILGDLGVERSAEVDRVVHRHLSAVPVSA